MKRFHLALSVRDLAASIEEYNRQFGCAPCVVVPGEYALWRTDALNISIRCVTDGPAGCLRHLGWEDASSSGFGTISDVNGIVWERFSARQQAAEIRSLWPDADCRRLQDAD